MAIWKIPPQYIIEYSPNGESIKTFSLKTKYLLEEIFNNLNELHTTVESISANSSVSSGAIGGIAVEIKDISDGQIVIYRESDKKFHNEDITSLSGDAKDIAHLTRLVENLYLTLNIAELNPGGYDGMSGETLYGDTNDIDTTTVNVMDIISGSNTITVDSTEGLIEGSSYLLIDEQTSLWVKVLQIISENRVNRLILQEPITEQFNPDTTKLIRSFGTIDEGSLSGDGAFFTTNLIPFVNEITGEETFMRRAYFAVKHQNVADAEITAEIALRSSATFVKGEVVGIGDDTEQTVTLANMINLTRYKFALYFNGVKQTKGFVFSPTTGEVSFIAPADAIVSVDYFYNWSEENFVEMTKLGTYPDRHNPNRATTQFMYEGKAGKAAALRLKLNQGAGYSENEIETTGTGKAQGFKLSHKAIEDQIQVAPANATWSYNEDLNTVVVNAPEGEDLTVSYYWRGKSFKVDSFACTFNE